MLVISASVRGSDGPLLKTCVLAHCLEPVAIGSSWVTENDLARETVVSQMASQGNSKISFGKAAAKFEVHESDYLLMVSLGIAAHEQLAFRFPKSDDFESFMTKALRPRGAYRVGDEIRTFDKKSPLGEEDFKGSEDAACLRKLWTLSCKVGKAEVESLAGIESESKPKVSGPMANELEEQAVSGRRIPSPLNDRERPSLYTLTKVQQNFSPSGSFQHLSWETYISIDAEGRLRRAGLLPKDAQELVLYGKELKVKDGDAPEIKTAKISDLTTLQEALELRARSMAMLSLAKYQVYNQLTNFFMAKLREIPPDGFRPPTLNEVRRCDRVLHAEIFTHVSKGVGSMDAGLSWHMERPEHRIWKLVEQSAEGTPDQGLEKVKGHRESKAEAASPEPVRVPKRQAPEASDTPVKDRMCIVCGKRHEPRCQIPPGFRKEQRRLQKEKDKKKKQKTAEGQQKK